MILYRPHRGSLKDSMKLVVEVEDMKSLVKEIQFDHITIDDKYINENTVHIQPYEILDSRTNWNTHVVTIDGYGAVGFTNGKF